MNDEKKFGVQVSGERALQTEEAPCTKTVVEANGHFSQRMEWSGVQCQRGR